MIVTEEEVRIASNVDLLQYLQSIGESIKKDGGHNYRHTTHDSLVIDSRNNYFAWNSQGVSGNAITYMTKVHHMSFPEAVKKINDTVMNRKISSFKSMETDYPEKFEYQVKEKSTKENVKKYLVDDRKIDEGIVNYLIKHDYIAEDTRNNVVFKWKEDNKLIGASLQGTKKIPIEKRLKPNREYFKQILPTTKEASSNGFNIVKGIPENLYFFESPIDLLSYLSLNKFKLQNCRLIAMNGVKESIFRESLNREKIHLHAINRDIQSIHLCVDNDLAGRNFLEKFTGMHYKQRDGNLVEVKGDIPKLPEGLDKWDWNNELQARVEIKIEKKFECVLNL